MKERIIALAEKVRAPPSWWWKVLGGVLLFAVAMWISYLLSRHADELARRRGEIAWRRHEALLAAEAARVLADVQARTAAEGAAAEALQRALIDEQELRTLEMEHKEHLEMLHAVADKDWETLNRLAGVK